MGWFGILQGRSDDNIETIRKRFKVFNEQTLPVIKHYETIATVHKVSEFAFSVLNKKQSACQELDGNHENVGVQINGLLPIDDVFAQIQPLFEPIVQVSSGIPFRVFHQIMLDT